MSEKTWAGATGFTGVPAVYFLVAGGYIRNEPPTPAEDAVGLGLLVLGGGFALACFITFCGWMSVRNARIAAEGPLSDQPPAT
jgi:hypothetical protein